MVCSRIYYLFLQMHHALPTKLQFFWSAQSCCLAYTSRSNAIVSPTTRPPLVGIRVTSDMSML